MAGSFALRLSASLSARLAAGLLVLAGTAAAPGGAAAASHVTILHFNDFHSQMEPYRGVHGEERGGIAYLAGAVDLIRRADPNTILLDAGDNVQGTPYFNAFHGEAEFRVLSLMKVDAMALGNHEFDNGLDALAGETAEARFPILSSNVVVDDGLGPPALQPRGASFPAAGRLVAVSPGADRAAELPPGVHRVAAPYAVYAVNGVRIGVIGVTTPTLPRIVLSTVNRGLNALPVNASVAPWVQELRPNADLVVVLSHCGLTVDSTLAAGVPGIDVIVSGHDHVALPQPRLIPNDNRNGIGGTLLVEAGSRGDFLGRLDLDVDGNRIVNFSGRLLPIGPAVPSDEDVLALVNGYQGRLDRELGEVIATAPRGLSAGGSMDRQVVLGRLVARSMLAASGADVAMENGGGIRSSIPPGPVTLADVYTVLPFENSIVTLDMTGTELQAFLDFGLSLRGRGGFPQMAGVSFVDGGSRAENVRVGPDPLDPSHRYRVAVNNYIYHGGDGYRLEADHPGAEDTGTTLRDAFIRFARDRKVLDLEKPEKRREAPPKPR